MRHRSASLVVAFLAAACGEPAGDRARRVAATTPGVRISMAQLHMAGGVPPRWKLTPPPGDAAAGRAAYAELGCHSCHAVEGESFPPPTGPGPELSGMGTHHPPAYFVEAILNPDAVLVEGPDYIGGDGRSAMPAYPDISLATLADLVAYLESLRQGGRHYVEPGATNPVLGQLPELPAPPAGAARRFLVQIYEVKSGQLAALEEWFRREGAARFLAYDGVVSVDTYVDVTRDGPPILTVIGFRDEEAQKRFQSDHATEQLSETFDAFIGPHPHHFFARAPLYRAPSLSAP